jgi:hypothetical protein
MSVNFVIDSIAPSSSNQRHRRLAAASCPPALRTEPKQLDCALSLSNWKKFIWTKLCVPANGTRNQRACTTRIFILKTMMFCYITTILNERKHLKMVIRSVPDSVSLNLGRTECPGLTALHRAHQFQLMRHRTFLKYSCHQLMCASIP